MGLAALQGARQLRGKRESAQRWLARAGRRGGTGGRQDPDSAMRKLAWEDAAGNDGEGLPML